MPYRLLADFVVVLHGAFVLFAVFGGLAVARWPRLAWFHVPVVAWAGLVELAGWTCPLTPLEIHFLELAGTTDYEGGFVEHYLIPFLYPEHLTRGVQLVLGVAVVSVNAAAYAWILSAGPANGVRGRRGEAASRRGQSRWRGSTREDRKSE